MDRALERGGSSRDAWERDWVMWVLWEVIGTLGGSESLVKLESVRGGTISSHFSGLKGDFPFPLCLLVPKVTGIFMVDDVHAWIYSSTFIFPPCECGICQPCLPPFGV